MPPSHALAVAGSISLRGDPILLDSEAFRRFTPTRFTPECAPVDEDDGVCFDYACPDCHLIIPRALFERTETLFFSVFGRPTSGKSYYITSMAYEMEVSAARRFGVSWTEPHPGSNAILSEYKSKLFGAADPDAFVELPKTVATGPKHYQYIRRAGAEIGYPRPFLFQVAPMQRHTNGTTVNHNTHNVCLYDNAGEHFRPGYAKPSHPESQHLSRASALFFVFDPTRDPGFIAKSLPKADDPQYGLVLRTRDDDQQHAILASANENVKRFLGREISDPLSTPLVVILAKYDSWKHILKSQLPAYTQKHRKSANESESLDVTAIEAVSATMRELLLSVSPSIVSGAERLSNNVCYIPVSATGTAPVVAGTEMKADGSSQERLKFVRGDLKPMWAEVPTLWALSKLSVGLVSTC